MLALRMDTRAQYPIEEAWNEKLQFTSSLRLAASALIHTNIIHNEETKRKLFWLILTV